MSKKNDKAKSASPPANPKEDFLSRIMDKGRTPDGAGAKRQTTWQRQNHKRFNAYGCQ